MTRRSDLLRLFSSSTHTRSAPTDPSIPRLCGYTPSYLHESRNRTGPVPDFRPSGFEGVDARALRRLESLERARVPRGENRRDL